ncbi:MAG: hypothetical protein GY839_15615 [candidate division Zixibacteria bacterium]|nr:hypothetical protein [candidate division Zixibacteria bacterium]
MGKYKYNSPTQPSSPYSEITRQAAWFADDVEILAVGQTFLFDRTSRR